MRWTGSCMAALVMATWLVAAPAARAQTEKEALQALPDNTLGFLAVNRLSQLDEKLAKLGQQKAQIKPLAMIRMFTGIEKGLDEKGTILAAAVQIGEATAEPAVLVFVPVTDYKEFITQLQAKNPDAEMTEITLPLINQEWLVGKRGKFAVAAMPKDREALKAALASRQGIPISDAISAYVSQNDVAGVLTTRGVKVFCEHGRKGLEQARGILDNLGPEAQAAGEMMEGLTRFLKSVETDVTHLAVGGAIDESGNLHVDARAVFAPGSGLARTGAEAAKPAPGGPLAGLPAGPFAVAMGGTMNEKTAAALLDLNMQMMKTMMKDVPAEKIKKLHDAYANMMKGFQAMGFVIQVGKGNEPLMGSAIAVVHTGNAEGYIKSYDQSIHDINELLKGTPVPFFPPMESKRIKIEGKPALEMTMDFSAIPGIDELKKPLEQVLGEGGKLTVTMAALDNKTVVARYTGARGLQETLQALKTNRAGLGNDAQIGKTATLLPEGSQWVIYINPEGAVQLANRALKMFEAPQQLPAFPATPPIGIAFKLSESGAQVHAAVPGRFLEALGQYIPRIKGLNLQ